MDATDPQAGDQGPEDVRRGLRTFVIGLVVLIVIAAIAAIAVALSNLGSDDDPSGGGTEGLAPAAVVMAPAAVVMAAAPGVMAAAAGA
jgi:hypothetical protein